jgi:hypothetical protein
LLEGKTKKDGLVAELSDVDSQPFPAASNFDDRHASRSIGRQEK